MLLGISGDYYPILDCLFQGEISLPIAFWELKLFSSAYIGKQLLILLIGLVWAVFFLHNSQIIRHLGPKNHQAGGLEDCGWKKNNNWINWVFIFQLVRFSRLWFCGDKGRSQRGMLGEEVLSGFNTFSRRGRVGLSNSCQVWSHPRVITELSFRSFSSVFFDYLNFTNYFIYFLIVLFIFSWAWSSLLWAFFLVAASGGYSPVAISWLLIAVASEGSRVRGLQLLQLPGSRTLAQ